MIYFVGQTEIQIKIKFPFFLTLPQLFDYLCLKMFK